MSHFDVDADFFENFDKSYTKIQDQEPNKGKRVKTVQLVDEFSAVYKNETGENQEQEDEISTARENTEDSTKRFRLESKTQAEKEKQEKSNKLLKASVIFILGFLLLNFVLVVIVMNRTSEISLPTCTTDFSACENQTYETGQIVDGMKSKLNVIEKWRNSTEKKFESHQFQIQSLLNQTKIDKQLEALEKDNEELKKSHEELTEQFESLSQKLDQLESNISSEGGFSLVTPTPTQSGQGISEAPQSTAITSCSVAMETLPSPRSKKQRIYPNGNSTSLEVLCDFETDGGGWTLLQKRSSGPAEEFNRTWNDYANGFGFLERNFWIGLENIQALTKNGDQELRIELEDFEGEKRYAKYSSFSVSDASDFYRLTIGGYSGDATDSMEHPTSDQDYFLNGMRFSTKDQDNDDWIRGHCAVEYYGGGGWWFNACGMSGLNGRYFEKGETVPYFKGVLWKSWKGWYYSLAKTEMKIRTRN